MPKRDHERQKVELRDSLRDVDAEIATLSKQLIELQNERKGLADAIAALEGIKRGSLPVSATTAGPIPHPPIQRLHILNVNALPKLTLLGYAEAVLRESGSPLGVADLVGRIQAKGRDESKPLATVRASLVSSLDRCVAKNQMFIKTGPGMYGLREWNSKSRTG